MFTAELSKSQPNNWLSLWPYLKLFVRVSIFEFSVIKKPLFHDYEQIKAALSPLLFSAWLMRFCNPTCLQISFIIVVNDILIQIRLEDMRVKMRLNLTLYILSSNAVDLQVFIYLFILNFTSSYICINAD